MQARKCGYLQSAQLPDQGFIALHMKLGRARLRIASWHVHINDRPDRSITDVRQLPTTKGYGGAAPTKKALRGCSRAVLIYIGELRPLCHALITSYIAFKLIMPPIAKPRVVNQTIDARYISFDFLVALLEYLFDGDYKLSVRKR